MPKSERYQPSNGTEGEGFISCWCAVCARDAKFRETEAGEDGCPILARTLAFDVTDAMYPDEWTYDAKGVPCCTAFVPEGKPFPTELELEQKFGQLRLIE